MRLYVNPFTPAAAPAHVPNVVAGMAAPVAWKDRQRLNAYTSNMSTDGHLQQIPVDIRQKYHAAKVNFGDYKLPEDDAWWADNNGPGGTTIAQFRQMSRVQQLALIDSIWNRILLLFPATKPRSAMLDPASISSSRAFQSGAEVSQAFANHGYCFRCDTRDPANVATYGFKRAYNFNPPAEIQETLPHRAANGIGGPVKVGMWKSNRDAVSEMTICVSRNLKGCTKFPKSEYTGAAWVYALKLPSDKEGFDTEHWQQNLPDATSLWRPGEKAFLDVLPAEVVASIPIQKTAPAGAADSQQGVIFRFQFLANAWTPHHVVGNDAQYLAGQLAAAYNGGLQQTVYRDEDFDNPRIA